MILELDPKDLKSLNIQDLKALCNEIRDEVIKIVSKTGGHLGANLGVVELSVALHYVFNTPTDKIIFDIGHQSYPHKLLTGRKHLMKNLRQPNGASGFTKRDESEYDHFGAGHSSTSISAALGFAVARDLKALEHNVVAVIGDGAMSAGMAYEAMNNCQNKKMIVILNDNDMSIAKPVGAMSTYLTKLLSSKSYHSIRNMAKEMLPKTLENIARKMEEHAKGMLTGGTLFECLGFYYLGPIDGHDIEQIIPILEQIKKINGPVLLHVITEKGKGYLHAENAPDKSHGVSKFDVITGKQAISNDRTYTSVFSNAILKAARVDDKIIAITAAMPTGTGLDDFAKEFKDRFFDVGIAEQHAVTFAAGLACEGFKPFVAIYSTFLQRAYDQIIHDVAIQKLPVRFMIDRAGFVGNDGPTHAGSFDLAYLLCIPDFVVMAPSCASELESMIEFATNWDSSPIAIRYPRGKTHEMDLKSPIVLGKANIIKSGNTAAIVSLGTRLFECMHAHQSLLCKGISTTLVDARFAKPFDKDLILELARTHKVLIFIEEGSVGGFGSHVLSFLSEAGALHPGIKTMAFKDNFEEQDSYENQNKKAGLDSIKIEQEILKLLNFKVSIAS